MTARRRMPEADRKSATLGPYRIRPADLETIRGYADAAGMSVSEFVREVCTGRMLAAPWEEPDPP